MEKPQFEAYVRDNGHNEFLEFYEGLSVKDRDKLFAVIARVQEHGLVVAQKMKWVKRPDKDLFELRSELGNNIQRALYFHVIGSRYIITHGFTKKTQRTPRGEIKHALDIRNEFFRRGG